MCFPCNLMKEINKKKHILVVTFVYKKSPILTTLNAKSMSARHALSVFTTRWQCVSVWGHCKKKSEGRQVKEEAPYLVYRDGPEVSVCEWRVVLFVSSNKTDRLNLVVKLFVGIPILFITRYRRVSLLQELFYTELISVCTFSPKTQLNSHCLPSFYFF